MKYFVFSSDEDIQGILSYRFPFLAELKKEPSDFLEKITPIGAKIIKCAENEELENLHELCHEAWPLLKFIKDKVHEAFMGALCLK
jgi:hypothetical protein